jgi:hypothetical protein
MSSTLCTAYVQCSTNSSSFYSLWIKSRGLKREKKWERGGKTEDKKRNGSGKASAQMETAVEFTYVKVNNATDKDGKWMPSLPSFAKCIIFYWFPTT